MAAAGQEVDRDAERLAVQAGGALRAVRVVVGADEAGAARECRERDREEPLDLRHAGGLGGRRGKQHAVGLGAAVGDVVQVEQAGQRVADEDDVASGERAQLAVERAAPGRERGKIRVGQVRVGDALAVGSQPGGEPCLPVPRSGALEAVQDEERAGRHRRYRSPKWRSERSTSRA